MGSQPALRAFLLLAMLLAPAAALPARVAAAPDQWVVNGPVGGEVTALAVDPAVPSHVYAAGSGGVWGSDDGGGHWAQLGRLPDDQFVQALAVQYPHVYASTVNGDVDRSSDGGATWSKLTPPSGGAISLSVVHGVLEVGTLTGAESSSDHGDTWTSQNESSTFGFSADPVRQILAAGDPGDSTSHITVFRQHGVYGCDGVTTVICGGGALSYVAATAYQPLAAGGYCNVPEPQSRSDVFVSAGAVDDNGAGLSERTRTNDSLGNPVTCTGDTGFHTYDRSAGLPSGDPVIGIWIQNPAMTSEADESQLRLYVATRAHGIYKSVDSGVDWSPANTGLGSLHVTALTGDPDTRTTLYAATFNGIYRSTDGANSWQRASGAPLAGISAVAVDPVTPSTAYAAAGEGVWKTSDGGATWSQSSAGLPAVDVDALAVAPSSPSTLYAGTTDEPPFDLSPVSNTPDPLIHGAGVFKSTDGGSSWAATSPLPYHAIGPLAVDPHDPNVVVAQSASGPPSSQVAIVRSTDGGATWHPVSGLSLASELAFGDDGTAYALSGSDTYRSSDDGASWSKVASIGGGNLDQAVPTQLALSPLDPSTLYASFEAVLQSGGQPGGVFRSTDRGATWQRVDAGIAAAPGAPVASAGGVAVDPADGRIFAGSAPTFDFRSAQQALYDGTGPYVATGAGPFAPFGGGGLPSRSFGQLAVDPGGGYLYAATLAGVGVVRFAADGSVSASAPASALAGDPVAFTFTVANAGPDAARGRLILHGVPGATAAGPGTSCSGSGDIVCDLPPMAAGGSASVVVSAAASAGTMTETAHLDLAQLDANPAGDDAAASIAVSPRPAAPGAPSAPSAPSARLRVRISGVHGTLRRSRLRRLRGTASDPVKRVDVAVVELLGGARAAKRHPACRILRSNGRLRKSRARRGRCSARGFLRARGTKHWSFKLRRKLPAGRYVVYVRATGSAGQRSTAHASFKLR